MANGRSSVDEGPESPTGPPNGFNGAPQQYAPPQQHALPGTATDDGLYNHVLASDIGINTLLARLKQSIASARDFATFLHKRAQVEEVHATSLKKLCRSTFEGARRPESRQGSYLQNYEALTRAHEKIADNGLSFALSLNQMHEDLLELAKDKESGRKHWKTNGLAAEKRSQDAEAAMDKAKSKYHTLAEDYHAIKTGDKSGARFGIRGPKNAAQVEEDTLRKMQAADADYSQRVQTAHAYRKELLESLRPQAVKGLEQLVNECDSALTLQVQKYVTFTEKLLLSNGLCVSPLDEGQGGVRSLRQIVQSIDNNMDLKTFVTSFASRASNAPEPKYERHPTQMATQQQPPQPQKPLQSTAPAPTSGAMQHQQQYPPPQQPPPSQQAPRLSDPFFSAADLHSAAPPVGASNISGPGSPASQHQAAFSSGPPPQGTYGAGPSTIQQVNAPPPQMTQHSQHMGGPPGGPPGGPLGGPSSGGQYPGQHIPLGQTPPQHLQMPEPTNYLPQQQHPGPGASMMATVGATGGMAAAGGEMRKHSATQQFGVDLQELMDRDGLPVPHVVQQCIQAVDLFGLDVEGIYRVSGNGHHIQKLRDTFDSGSSTLDFRNPEAFYHDVNSVAGLLKQFFRDLPDPLLTRQHYHAFTDAAHIDDDVARRDSIHAAINELPDPNYATLRALILHLHRVQEHQGSNRMNAGNLAICFGPTLMVAQQMQNIADAGWQVRVVDTILQNTLQIFDDD